jgi:dihydropteroate synthase
MKLRARDAVLPLDRTVVMGVLNVTPDSFSDGGRWLDPGAAVDHALDMVEAGAAIIDIGGESTRPGAQDVSEEEELKRVLPVIERLAARASVLISIDTRKPAVARRALAAGASILNDVSGEEADPAMDVLAAESGAAIVVMHSRGRPSTMRLLAVYDDVVGHVKAFLASRAAVLVESGVSQDAIVLDPGFGFAKTPEQNLVLLNALGSIVELGYPVLSGTSRKSFIGKVLDLPEDERIEGSIATAVWAIVKGARLLRVHDVAATVRAARVTEAIIEARDTSQ